MGTWPSVFLRNTEPHCFALAFPLTAPVQLEADSDGVLAVRALMLRALTRTRAAVLPGPGPHTTAFPTHPSLECDGIPWKWSLSSSPYTFLCFCLCGASPPCEAPSLPSEAPSGGIWKFRKEAFGESHPIF